MSYKIKPEDVTQGILELAMERFENAYWNDVTAQNVADFLEDAIDAGLVSPPCHFIAYPSGMPVMHEPGEPIQIYPGKCSEPHHRHWKGQTS